MVELRHEGPEKPGSQREPDERPESTDGGSSRLRCSSCGNLVANTAALFCMTGQDGPSVYVNPHGRVFEIVTLRTAQGLIAMGGTTTEHTWFAGYGWQVVLCRQCLTHLGWRFTASAGGISPPSFFGLIRSCLVEDDAPEE